MWLDEKCRIDQRSQVIRTKSKQIPSQLCAKGKQAEEKGRVSLLGQSEAVSEVPTGMMPNMQRNPWIMYPYIMFYVCN